jgi:hypothetical protein
MIIPKIEFSLFVVFDLVMYPWADTCLLAMTLVTGTTWAESEGSQNPTRDMMVHWLRWNGVQRTQAVTLASLVEVYISCHASDFFAVFESRVLPNQYSTCINMYLYTTRCG